MVWFGTTSLPHQYACAVYFYVFPSEFPDFSPGLSPQPDNACRSAALYGSIKIPLLFAGEVKCGKCDVCGPRVVQVQCFQMTFVVPPVLCFAAATYIRTSISTEAYVQVEQAETPICTNQKFGLFCSIIAMELVLVSPAVLGICLPAIYYIYDTDCSLHLQ